MSDRDAGFCSGGEELDSEGAASAASAPLASAVGDDADADEALSPTDASEDSVEVRVHAVAAPPPPPPPASPPRKRKTPDARKSEVASMPSVAPPPPKKRRLAPSLTPAPFPTMGSGPFRPWSVEFSDAYTESRQSPALERLRGGATDLSAKPPVDPLNERLRPPVRISPAEAEYERKYSPSPLRSLKSETVTSSHVPAPCERLSPNQGLCLRLDPRDRRSASHSPRPRVKESEPRLRIDSFETAERLRASPSAIPRPTSAAVKMEPPPTPEIDDSLSRFSYPPTSTPGRCTPRSSHPSTYPSSHTDPHLSPERLRVKPEPTSTPVRSRSGSSDSRLESSESSRARVKHESLPRAEGSFSVAALLGASDPGAPGPSSAPQAPSSASSSSSQQPSAPQQQRNYKNMTRERRIEANARERTRVHTISAAFDTLRRAVPAYSHAQKLSKLSVLRVACAYILTLSRAAGKDYSADESAPSLESCVDLVTRTIHTEGKLRRKRDE